DPRGLREEPGRVQRGDHQVTGGARLRQFGLAALALALGACATAPPPPPVAAPPPVVAPPAPPPEVTAPVPSPLERLASAHREKAQALERDGRLRDALDEWKVAVTVDPKDPAAREGKTKLEAVIERGAPDRVRQGREALARGDQREARRHFLAALALDPANAASFDALQNEIKEIRFITHTVRAGETLATLAQRYYGDRSRSEVIWETNQLPPNPRLSAGTVLKIPEIPGVPFVNPENRPRPPAEVAVRPPEPARESPSREAPSREPAREAPPQETTEINP